MKDADRIDQLRRKSDSLRCRWTDCESLSQSLRGCNNELQQDRDDLFR